MKNIHNEVAEITRQNRFEYAYQDLCQIKYGAKTRYFAEKIGIIGYFLILIGLSVGLIKTNLNIVILVLFVLGLLWWMSLTVFIKAKLYLYLNSRWKLNALLNHYSPMNSDLYRELQENVRYNPTLFFPDLRIWAAKESQYFDERPKNFGKKGLDFTERVIK